MRLKIVFINILMLCFTHAFAQQGLHVSPLFEGRIVPMEQMIVVKVRGKAISKYNLNYYHSIKFKPTEEQLKTMNELAGRDEKEAVSSEHIGKKGSSTTILSMKPAGRMNRFLCIITSGKEGEKTVTIVYMEGRVKNIKELRKLINN